MIRVICTVFGLLIGQVVLGQNQIKVVGTVTGDTEGHNTVYLYNQMFKDSTTIKDGHFEINFTDDNIGSRAISLGYDKAKRRMFSPLVLFYDRSGTIQVEFDMQKGLSSGKVKGLASAQLYNEYGSQKVIIFQSSRAATLAKYGEGALNQGSANYDAATEYNRAMSARLNDSLLNVFVQADQFVAPVFILSQLSTMPVDRIEYYYNRLSPEVKAGDDGKTVYAKIQGLKNAYIGAIVKDFKLANEEGTERSFADFKGKYVLLDFWASWCAPCRASFPRIREVNSKLTGKDFVIVNISIDKNKDAWLKAVKEESNPWPQLYDDRKIASELFNVSAVPTSYLIDPTGKIIMKEIGFDPKGGGAMEKKLEEIFKVKF